ncbi:MAG: hypothetical protein WHV44_02755 [Anaerolineales bacterium]
MKASVSPIKLLQRISVSRGAMFATILLLALLAFEVFNYSTTDFALTDLLGNELKFMGIRWATILSIAFCGIDFAGIARLFTPEKGRDEPVEVWYLFGAWVLAAAMNATLTWWGVSVAINSHTPQGSAVVPQETLTKGVPIFVAVMVWVIRLLLIGTFSIAGERIFSMADDVYRPAKRYDDYAPNVQRAPMVRPAPTPAPARPANSYAAQRSPVYIDDAASNGLPFRPSPKPEPSYHPLGASSANPTNTHAVRR